MQQKCGYKKNDDKWREEKKFRSYKNGKHTEVSLETIRNRQLLFVGHVYVCM